MREAPNLRAGRNVFEILLQHHRLAVRTDEVYLESADLFKKEKKEGERRKEKKESKMEWSELEIWPLFHLIRQTSKEPHEHNDLLWAAHTQGRYPSKYHYSANQWHEKCIIQGHARELATALQTENNEGISYSTSTENNTILWYHT